MKTKYLLYITIVLFFVSCREFIDIELEEKEKLMVLNGIINTDSALQINIAKSMGVLESHNAFSFIDDATVELYTDNEFRELMVYDNLGYYKSSVIPEAEKEYEIRASHNLLKNIKAQVYIPKPVPISSIKSDFKLDSVTEQWWNPQTQEYFDTTIVRISEEGTIKLNFTDPPEDRNYYFVTFSCLMPVYKWQDGYEIRVGEQMVNLYYEHATLSYENRLRLPNLMGYVISDELFNGQSYTFTARIYSWSFSYSGYDYYYGGNHLPLSPIYVNLHTVPEDLYKFVTSYSRYEDASYNPFAEPVNVYTNVENGYGLFTGYSTATDSVGFN